MLAPHTLIPSSTIQTHDGVESHPLRMRSALSAPTMLPFPPQQSAVTTTPMQPPSSTATTEEFMPIFTEHAPSSPLDTNAVIGFNVSSSKGYYAVMRTIHYLCEALTPIAASCIGYLMNHTHSDSPELAKTHAFDNFDRFLKVESFGLSLIAMNYLRDQYMQLRKDVAPALALEYGKAPDEVSFQDMMHSRNPIISVEVHRFIARAASRFGASIPFAFGLPQGDGMDKQLRITPGLIGVALNIWLERTAFYAKTPYDLLSDGISDVQSNILSGEVAAQQTVAVFQRTLQAAYQHRGREGLNIAEMQALQPLLAQAARDVIDRKIGVDTVIAILGGGIIIPDNIEQSTKNYAYIREYGMDGAVQKAITQRRSLPDSTTIWQQQNSDAKAEELANSPLTIPVEQLSSARERSWQREYFNSSFPDANLGI